MQLTIIDLIVIALYFAINLAVALFLRKRATKSVSDFFISGRNVSWWLAGTSMVATTFAADTPLVVTGLVARNGIAGNWIWWSMAFSGMLTVFFFAKLWRRAGVLTDVEFAEIRYSGKPATFLRWFRAVYLGLPINLIILGWVNLAIVKIMMLVLGVSKIEALDYRDCHHVHYRVNLNALGLMGSVVDRLVPVCFEDGDGHPARRLRD